MTLSLENIASFQTFIFFWWETNKRDLPWRHTHDPYKILVSELMLQQTQVSRVLPKYQEFLNLFPTVGVLAKSSTGDVLKAWKGMGYNRRALYLKKLAENIVQNYESKFPDQEKELLKLPGLGIYTARAVLVFAFRQDISMIDTNIRQIIIHHFFEDIGQKESIVQEIGNQLVPMGKSWEWHQALMDYGAIEMKKLKISNITRNRAEALKSLGDKKVPQSSLPFKQTNRFFRGRIIDLLRENSWQEDTLLLEIIRLYGKDKAFLTEILQGLLNDGLIERSKTGIISLPR